MFARLRKCPKLHRFVRQNTRVFVEVEALEGGALQAGKIPADYTGGVKRTMETEVESGICE